MYLPRIQLEQLEKLVSSNKVVVIFGPRRSGKTTLIQKYLEKKNNYLFVPGEDIFVREFLSSGSVDKLKNFIGEKELLVIDEAQYISDIGLNLKLIVDHIPNVKVIAMLSSTFDLNKQLGEPLTGRKKILKIFPIAQMELNKLENKSETRANLESRLIYGSYRS